MSDERLAKVGDVIAHGQAIPGNVRSVRDKTRDTWDRFNGGWTLVSYKGERYDDSTAPLADDYLVEQWGPLAVVEVDPEPRTAEAEGDVHYYVSELRPGATFCGISLEEDNDLSTTDEPGKATCDTCRAEADEDAMPGSHTVRVTMALDIDDRDGKAVISTHHLGEIGSCDRQVFLDSIAETFGVRITPAEPGPLVLTLPEVPAEAVALRGGARWVRSADFPEMWVLADGGSTLHHLGALLDREEGSVTVEFAPPREPRTWSKLDEAPEIDDLPRTVDVEGHGRWSRLATHHFYPEADPNGAPLTLAGLRELGEVREVLS